MVSGGDIEKQFAHVKELLGKEIKIDQIFETGPSRCCSSTKGMDGKGNEKMECKKEKHKSRKTVRSWVIVNFPTKHHVHSSKSRTNRFPSKSRIR